MKIYKILWIIAGFLVLVLILYLNKDNFNVLKTRKVSGIGDKEINISLKPYPKKINDSKPNIYSKAYYLIDVDTALSLVAKNENLKLPIASTTKIATGLVVLENYSDRIQEIVTITSKMTNVSETTIKLRIGEKITVERLLDGLLIMSGNDAAFALAEHFGGQEKFVTEMNEKAAKIGANNTKYFDPSGLDERGYSNAHDLAIIGAYALRNPKFAQIVKTPEKTITSTNGKITHELKNSNRMMRVEELYFYPFAIGIKTGFTYEAGHVLVSAAEKDGHKILSVVLNTNENTTVASAKESKKLLEWGFANWSWDN